MTALRAAIGIAVALMVQLAAGRFAPDAARYADVLLLPLAVYALKGSQRSAMGVGCVSGLLQDFWTEPRLFGLNGLVKTVLGWGLGGLGARFEINRLPGRFAAGAALHLAETALSAAVRRLFGEAVGPVSPLPLLVRALVGGLLTAAVLAIVDRVGRTKGRRSAAPVRRKA